MTSDDDPWKSNEAFKRYVAEGVALGFENIKIDVLEQINQRRRPGTPPIQWHHVIDGIHNAVWWSRFTGRVDSLGWRIAVMGMAVVFGLSMINSAQDLIDISRKKLGLESRQHSSSVNASRDIGETDLGIDE